MAAKSTKPLAPMTDDNGNEIVPNYCVEVYSNYDINSQTVLMKAESVGRSQEDADRVAKEFCDARNITADKAKPSGKGGKKYVFQIDNGTSFKLLFVPIEETSVPAKTKYKKAY